MRAVFMGTPEFAVPSLEATAERCDLAAVVAQPDRPQGRGQRLAPPPTARWARERGVPLLQPDKIRTPSFLSLLQALAPEIIIVVAYGRILPGDVLLVPRRGCVNVHASLLPKYRGAAPIQWAIAGGERETGVTLMQMGEGLDDGPVLARRSCEIREDETGEALSARLAVLGAELLRESLPLLEREELSAVPQEGALATLAPKLRREDAIVDWRRPAKELHDRARAFQPWPGALVSLPEGGALKIVSTAAEERSGQPGEVLVAGAAGLVVAAAHGALRLIEVQPEGRRRMRAEEFLSGHPLLVGTRLPMRAS
ncbi:MAG: methionyl-tRNA formyltransferase [Deltaproteobacteria bacterium]